MYRYLLLKLLFIYAFIHADASLECYSCNSTTCNEPQLDSSITTEVCNDGEVCISALSSNTSVVRKCYKSNDIFLNPCTNLQKIDSNITTCYSCENNLCNFHRIRATPITCYECDPSNHPERCDNPETSSLSPNKITCPSNSVCVSMYASRLPNENGIYRACLQDIPANHTNPCSLYKEGFNSKGLLIKECYSCFDDLCNKKPLTGTPLECYSCDPTSQSAECNNPLASKNILKTENCSDTHGNNHYVCLSASQTSTNDKSKSEVYRKCLHLNDNVDDPCDFYKQETNSDTIDVKDCSYCNTTLCNRKILKSSGSKVYFSLTVFIFWLVRLFI